MESSSRLYGYATLIVESPSTPTGAEIAGCGKSFIGKVIAWETAFTRETKLEETECNGHFLECGPCAFTNSSN